jgi:hypothetical protein
MRRLVPFAVAALLAIVVSGCAVYKPGSFLPSQPTGLGDAVRLHLELCSEGEPPGAFPCEPNGTEGELQYMLVFAMPNGTTAPATVKAVPGPGAFAIDYTRSQEVADRFAEEPGIEEEGGGNKPWPPAGTELVGYLSNVVSEERAPAGAGTWEWTIDADFRLPAAADGGRYGGPVVTAVGTGWRRIDEPLPANRPLDCSEHEPSGPEFPTTECHINEEATLPVSDLTIAPPAPVTAYVGANAPIAFSFNFASSVSPPPSFALAATTTLAKATISISDGGTFAAASVDPTTHRAPAATRTATVAIPRNAKPGSYDVTLTAKTAAGGTVTQVAKLQVTKPAIKIGKAKLDKAKGTATLSVKVPGAGTLSLSGKGITKVKRNVKAAKAKTVKLTIKLKGKAKATLLETGKAKVKANVNFKPRAGSAVSKTKPITVKKSI